MSKRRELKKAHEARTDKLIKILSDARHAEATSTPTPAIAVTLAISTWDSARKSRTLIRYYTMWIALLVSAFITGPSWLDVSASTAALALVVVLIVLDWRDGRRVATKSVDLMEAFARIRASKVAP